ncbi:MAG: hypothetical protein J0M12_03755 [Deltaproteobacteria bacterium]|nr:hypothetical protein [Deltaproteobacteria bacterium]
MKQSGKNKKNKLVRDPAKEKLFKELSEQLAQRGFTVRREKLKQGYGWKVVSGACQALGQRLIFVDQRMTQDDQISFLQARLLTLDSAPATENSAAVPA